MLEFGTYDIASRRPWSYFLAGRRCRKICSTNAKSKSSKPPKPLIDRNARVAKLADAPDLGSGAARHGGSSPSARTMKIPALSGIFFTRLCHKAIAAIAYLGRDDATTVFSAFCNLICIGAFGPVQRQCRWSLYQYGRCLRCFERWLERVS